MKFTSHFQPQGSFTRFNDIVKKGKAQHRYVAFSLLQQFQLFKHAINHEEVLKTEQGSLAFLLLKSLSMNSWSLTME